MAEEATEEKKESGGGNKGLLIILIVLIVLLLGAVGFIGWYVFMGQKQDDPNAPKQEKQVKKEEAGEDENAQTFTAEVKDMVVNVTTAKGRIKLMKLSLALTSPEPTIEQIVQNNEPEIKDAVIRAVSARTAEELLTVAGKELLKEELLNDINEIINEATMANPDIKKNIVKKIYFTAFVMR